MPWLRVFWSTVCAAFPRGIALFLGLFTLVNVIGECRFPGFDANLWWIGLPGAGGWIEPSLLLWSAACFLWFGTHWQFARFDRIALGLTFSLLLAISVWNVRNYFQLLSEGRIQTLSPFPFSAIVAAGLVIFLYMTLRTTSPVRDGSATFRKLATVMTCLMCVILFPLAQMVCFGMTDYRRRADVVVVFGAKVYEDGSLSSIVEERVQGGCELYHQGLVQQILFSGGPGLGPVHEAEGMRARARELGVPASAILMDFNGFDTESTVINTLQLAQTHHWDRILAVSQSFHLPRIKLAFHRQRSEVYTVPAKRLYHFRSLPYFVMREIAAWWFYYLRPLAG